VYPRVLEPLLRDGHLEIELRNRRKSAEECFVRLSLSVLRDEPNLPYGMLGVAIDITEQRRAEQALRQSEERYRGVANAMPQVAYITGPEGRPAPFLCSFSGSQTTQSPTNKPLPQLVPRSLPLASQKPS
jgi:PAS domain-containing protein